MVGEPLIRCNSLPPGPDCILPLQYALQAKGSVGPSLPESWPLLCVRRFVS